MLVLTVLYYVLFVFWLLLIARIIAEVVRSMARDWHPRGVMAVVLEAIFTVTDPPVRLLRKVIPAIPIGGARLDVSIMVLLFAVFILMQYVGIASVS
ncbi:MAG: YggT family protein [Mycobacteriaceae bacterium]